MRFAVETWAPEYGASVEDVTLPASEAAVDVNVEVPAQRWQPLRARGEAARPVVFIDGVRRVDARVWITGDDGTTAAGICASYAAGAVQCGERARLCVSAVERGVFTAAPGAAEIVTAHGTYRARATAGDTPEAMSLGLQQRMAELEAAVPGMFEGDCGWRLLVVDGPLRQPAASDAVGYVKTHHTGYLPPVVADVIGQLQAGERTPLFLVSSVRSRFSWYMRLPAEQTHMWAGIVRCEVTADREVASAVSAADLVAATLPRFASNPHKDSRAPQNLYPIAGLERELRRRLGDPALLYRALRAAAK